jgi:hypothetical protein
MKGTYKLKDLTDALQLSQSTSKQNRDLFICSVRVSHFNYYF